MSYALLAMMLYWQVGDTVTTRLIANPNLLPPELSIRAKQHIINVDQTLHVTCRGSAPLSWHWPNQIVNGSEKPEIIHYSCEDNDRPFCSNLTLNKAQAKDTGYYSCSSSSSNSSLSGKKKTRVYIFVKDENSPFVNPHTEIPEAVHMSSGNKLVIPCRVTAPDFKVSLKMFSLSSTVDGKEFKWDSKLGFIIPRPTYKFIGLLTCETTMNGRTFQSFYLTFRQVHNIKDIQLNATSPLKIVSGETLALMCTVTTGLNTRIQFFWDYPDKENRRPSTTQKIDRTNPRVNKFYSVLVMDKISTSDKGKYKCEVKSGPVVKEKKIKVIVYEKPFISVRCIKPCLTQASAGQRVYRFPIKVKAFPPPEVSWLKDGLPLTDISARYKVTGDRLAIRDVSEEDFGNYTMILSLNQWSLYKNITLSLSVNGASALLSKERLKELSEFQTAVIIDYHLCKKSVREISKRTGIPKSAVSAVINKYRKAGNAKNKSCPERAKKGHSGTHRSLRKLPKNRNVSHRSTSRLPSHK